MLRIIRSGLGLCTIAAELAGILGSALRAFPYACGCGHRLCAVAAELAGVICSALRAFPYACGKRSGLCAVAAELAAVVDGSALRAFPLISCSCCLLILSCLIEEALCCLNGTHVVDHINTHQSNGCTCGVVRSVNHSLTGLAYKMCARHAGILEGSIELKLFDPLLILRICRDRIDAEGSELKSSCVGPSLLKV